METKIATSPKVILVGAGPGDPELISLKGIRAIEQADVILYDALVSKQLLQYAPKHAKKIYVGKRSGNHTLSQDGINKLMLESAFNHGTVVRLKGGDPYVFGRGHEELVYLQTFGVEVELVPGISSAFSVPELQHIPLTKRGVSESFWTITGTTKSGRISNDVKLAATSDATVLILMGMKKLPQIVELYQQQDKGDLPIAIIQNGSMPNERVGIGTIDTIVGIVEKEGLGAPAIIVIGDVVTEKPEVPTVLSPRRIFTQLNEN